jgi:glycerate 2-kinase
VEIPVADGGDGTVEALVTAGHGVYHWANVEGPLGDPVVAQYGLIEGGRTAVVELASASGYELITAARRDPRSTSTYGFGQLLLAAREPGVERIIAGIGGSATNDAGAGMLQALGVRLMDVGGNDIERGGEALLRLERIDAAGLDPGWHSVRINVATDVRNPLVGPEGASHVYGPQKGADAASVELLDQALAHFARMVERDLGKSVAGAPGAGAAGGTGAALMAFLDAELMPGAALIVEAAGLPAALHGADLVITGEGRVDSQTAYGKAPGEVARRAHAAGVPVLFLAGTKSAGWDRLEGLGIRTVATLEDEIAHEPGPERQNLSQLMQNAGSILERLAARTVAEHRW